jgi:SHS2 domain-containing protein
MAGRPAGHREIEHTADWAMQVWADEVPELFRQAALGMYALSGIILAESNRVPVVSRRLMMEAPDLETLLVSFLSELLHISEDERVAFDEITLSIMNTRLDSALAGREIILQAKEIKAVTFHNLNIREFGGQYEVEIVFDV